MWMWLLGILGAGGAIATALVFVAPFVPVLGPAAAWIIAIAGAVWRIVTAAFVWSWRQAVAAPAWTAVLLGVALLAWFLSGQRGYDHGKTDCRAAQIVVHDKQVIYIKAAGAVSQARTNAHADQDKHNKEEVTHVAQAAAALSGAGDECIPADLADRLRQLH